MFRVLNDDVVWSVECECSSSSFVPISLLVGRVMAITTCIINDVVNFLIQFTVDDSWNHQR